MDMDNSFGLMGESIKDFGIEEVGLKEYLSQNQEMQDKSRINNLIDINIFCYFIKNGKGNNIIKSRSVSIVI